MKTDHNANLPEDTKPATSLTKVLRQSKRVEELVKESVEELSSVNTDLKQDFASQRVPSLRVAAALERSESVEDKVEQASVKLEAVNEALAGEVRERVTLDQQFAAVTKQRQVAHHASMHDVLTGLPNRALFNDRLKQAIAQARRHRRALAVMFLDLDQFKDINDLHGHDVGDRVLKTVAQRLEQSIRSDDTVSRLGGDEFVFVLMEIPDQMSIAMIAETIMKAIQAPLNVDVRDHNIDLSLKASIGISIFPKDGTTVDALVSSADLAMYQAKRSKSGHSFAQDRNSGSKGPVLGANR